MRDDGEFRMNEIARELKADVHLDASFDASVMAAVRRLPRHRRFGLWSRLTTPRRQTITMTPLSYGILAASIAVFAILGAAHASVDLHRVARPIVNALMPAKKAAPSQRVQFVLVAPDAKKVAVVGDFNGWDPKHAAYQAQHRGGGVWSVTAPVPVGHHRYSFIVDDSVWVADPMAPRIIDSDYGVANSAIVVEEK
ncbi:MAG TPA: isoamylase early set domain-containing protein [Gemmatimonadaceae bacterium]|nr:isoamylase early set domain-containing protein [Gemmatimonadaceae bacterium]